MKRIKYNWLFAIEDLGLIDDFEQYKIDSNFKQHLKGKKELSINRLARAYILHISKEWNWKWILCCDDWIVGKESSIKAIEVL